MSRDRPYVGGECLLHPAFLGAIALLALNDHVLKRAWPGVVTGKLSDAAGLCFFPVFLVALLEVATRRKSLGWSWLVGCALATAIVFTLVKTSWLAAEAYRHGLGSLHWAGSNAWHAIAGGSPRAPHPVALTRDPTDLLALPMAALAPWIERRRRGRS